MRRLAPLLCLLAFASPTAAALESDTVARAAMVTDLTTGIVLLEKNADDPLPPASMSKLMTINMVFEALQAGRLAMSDEFRTSARAAGMGGSKMFIRDGESVSVENLLRGVIVQSGNDAAVALAEGMSGTEEAFARRMNERAPRIGLTNSTFANATGWPHPEHRMSVRDIAALSARLATAFPEYLPMFAETEFAWDGIVQRNRNPLLGLGLGVDGLKTGHTSEAGYGLAATAARGNRRVVTVVAGLESPAQRKREAERLVNWAFRAFELHASYEAGRQIAEVPVWIGAEPLVPVAPARDAAFLAPVGERARLSVAYAAPVPAPIAEGDRVGELRIEAPGMAPVSIPLVAMRAVAEGGFAVRVRAAIRSLWDGGGGGE